ncbi:PREDICTED: uncharacterized protein LOC107329643 [Acropora digitifera]|uniref:uncharacterized protein LOC107329643 n=1 Tax=Acropora digitifera TaxID=70779 RepID=UPI00077ADAD3|nr:PREDICTED: uncharacterized protein LOC107329643 [Acropora digitifera]
MTVPRVTQILKLFQVLPLQLCRVDSFGPKQVKKRTFLIVCWKMKKASIKAAKQDKKVAVTTSNAAVKSISKTAAVKAKKKVLHFVEWNKIPKYTISVLVAGNCGF